MSSGEQDGHRVYMDADGAMLAKVLAQMQLQMLVTEA